MKLKDLLNTTYTSKEELKDTLLNKVDDVKILKIVDKSECVLCTNIQVTKNSWIKVFSEINNNYMLHLIVKDDIIKVTKIEKENKLEHYRWEV